MLVSAGFDAARGDPLGGYQVTPEGYAHLTHQLMSLAAGRVVVILEVGFTLNTCIGFMLCNNVNTQYFFFDVFSLCVKQ